MELSSVCKPVTLTGLELLRLQMSEVVEWLLTCGGIRRKLQPLSRNEQISQRYAEGDSLSDLASAFAISPQRVYQIVHHKRK